MKKIIALIVASLAFCLLAGCGGTNAPNDAQEPSVEVGGINEDNTEVTVEEVPPEESAEPEIPPVSEDVVTDEGFDQFAPPEKGDTVAIMKTSMGEISIKLFPEDAPKAVENFTTHAKNGYYDGVTFHRVIDNFMIQGGDPEGTGRGGESIYGEPFEDEFSVRLHNYRGALSMANAGVSTNGSQFFIVQAGAVDSATLDALKQISEYEEAMYPDLRTGQVISGAQRVTQKAIDIYGTVGGTPALDGGLTAKEGYPAGHTVFGQVYEGMDVVDAIAKVATDENDKPAEPVIIEKIEVIEY